MRKFDLKITALLLIIVFNTIVMGQGVSINNNGASADTSAILDISSTTKGLLIPRMTTVERNAILSPAPGLLIWNTDCGNINSYDGNSWQPVNSTGGNMPATAGTITGTASICVSQSGVSYSISPISGATGYIWSYSGTGFSIASGNNTNSITADFSAGATSGSLTVTGTNACGTGLASPSYVITLNSAPDDAGTISGTATVCQSESGVAFSVAAITGATGYIWSYSGSGFSIASGANTNSITADFSASATSGILTVYGTNTCGNGIVSPDYSITVTASPAAPVAIAGSGATETQITANWNAVAGATHYHLDVSTVSNFLSYVAGFQDLDVGNVTTKNVTGLTCATTYYYRVRAQANCDTSLSSNTISYSTAACSGPCAGVSSVQDYDGNTYNTQEIGTQCWLRSNMTTTKYANGVDIGAANYKTYACGAASFNAAACGKLYTWDVFMSANNPCPIGWHSPTENEYQTLQTTVSNHADWLKSPSWYSCGGNCTGFDSWICGQYYSGHFEGCGSAVGDQCYFWSKPSWSTYGSVVQVMGPGSTLNFNTTQLSWTTGGNFYSIRCIKD